MKAVMRFQHYYTMYTITLPECLYAAQCVFLYLKRETPKLKNRYQGRLVKKWKQIEKRNNKDLCIWRPKNIYSLAHNKHKPN